MSAFIILQPKMSSPATQWLSMLADRKLRTVHVSSASLRKFSAVKQRAQQVHTYHETTYLSANRMYKLHCCQGLHWHYGFHTIIVL